MNKLLPLLLFCACSAPPSNSALADAQKTAVGLATFRVALEAKDFGAIATSYGANAQSFVLSTVAAHPWASGGGGLGAALDARVQTYIAAGSGSSDDNVKEAAEEAIYGVVLHASFEQVYGAAALDTAAGWDTAFGLYGDSGGAASGLGDLAVQRDTEFGLANESSILAAFSSGRAAAAQGRSGADSLSALDSGVDTVFGLSLRHEFAEAAGDITVGKSAAALEGFGAGSELWPAERDRLATSYAGDVGSIDAQLARGSVSDATTMGSVDFSTLVNLVHDIFNLPI